MRKNERKKSRRRAYKVQEFRGHRLIVRQFFASSDNFKAVSFPLLSMRMPEECDEEFVIFHNGLYYDDE